MAPMYSGASIQLFRDVMDRSAVDADDIDEDKYQILKKLSEVWPRYCSSARAPAPPLTRPDAVDSRRLF